VVHIGKKKWRGKKNLSPWLMNKEKEKRSIKNKILFDLKGGGKGE